LVRAGKNEAANRARMGNIKTKMEFLSLTVSLYGCWLPWKWGEELLSLSLVPMPKRKKIRASIEGS
jgi:hypothetical protein